MRAEGSKDLTGLGHRDSIKVNLASSISGQHKMDLGQG